MLVVHVHPENVLGITVPHFFSNSCVATFVKDCVLLNCFTPFVQLSSSILADLVTGRGNSWGSGAIPLSSSLLREQVPSCSLSILFVLFFFFLSYVLSGFIIFFFFYHNLEVFCLSFSQIFCVNNSTNSYIFNVFVGVDVPYVLPLFHLRPPISTF